MDYCRAPVFFFKYSITVLLFFFSISLIANEELPTIQVDEFSVPFMVEIYQKNTEPANRIATGVYLHLDDVILTTGSVVQQHQDEPLFIKTVHKDFSTDACWRIPDQRPYQQKCSVFPVEWQHIAVAEGEDWALLRAGNNAVSAQRLSQLSPYSHSTSGQITKINHLKLPGDWLGAYVNHSLQLVWFDTQEEAWKSQNYYNADKDSPTISFKQSAIGSAYWNFLNETSPANVLPGGVLISVFCSGDNQCDYKNAYLQGIIQANQQSLRVTAMQDAGIKTVLQQAAWKNPKGEVAFVTTSDRIGSCQYPSFCSFAMFWASNRDEVSDMVLLPEQPVVELYVNSPNSAFHIPTSKSYTLNIPLPSNTLFFKIRTGEVANIKPHDAVRFLMQKDKSWEDMLDELLLIVREWIEPLTNFSVDLAWVVRNEDDEEQLFALDRLMTLPSRIFAFNDKDSLRESIAEQYSDFSTLTAVFASKRLYGHVITSSWNGIPLGSGRAPFYKIPEQYHYEVNELVEHILELWHNEKVASLMEAVEKLKARIQYARQNPNVLTYSELEEDILNLVDNIESSAMKDSLVFPNVDVGPYEFQYIWQSHYGDRRLQLLALIAANITLRQTELYQFLFKRDAPSDDPPDNSTVPYTYSSDENSCGAACPAKCQRHPPRRPRD